MTIKALGRCVALLGLSALLVGCTIRHGDFTVISGKLVDTSDFRLGQADRAKGIEGEDMAHVILGIPTANPTLDAALDDACKKGDGDVVTDAVVESFGWSLILYGQKGWRVRGDVVSTRRK